MLQLEVKACMSFHNLSLIGSVALFPSHTHFSVTSVLNYLDP